MKGMEEMTATEGREIIREIMTTYDKYRLLWLEAHGTDEGFNDWFNKQTQCLNTSNPMG